MTLLSLHNTKKLHDHAAASDDVATSSVARSSSSPDNPLRHSAERCPSGGAAPQRQNPATPDPGNSGLRAVPALGNFRPRAVPAPGATLGPGSSGPGQLPAAGSSGT